MVVAVAALVITGTRGLTVNKNVRLPIPPELIAVRVMLLLPTVVGIPEITPVTELRLKPTGKPVASKLVGALSAVIV